MEKTILVTGGAGFIGSHLCEMYIAEGYNVVCIDNLVSGNMNNLADIIKHPSFTFVQGDIRDRELMMQLFEAHRPNHINHHAAQKSVAYSVENPSYDLDVNLVGLMTILDCVKAYPIENFIYVSSGGALSKKIEGNEKSSEADTPQLISPYALTKFTGEKYIEMYAAQYGYDFTVVRYANIYGPRQVPDGECGVIPIFLNNILAEKPSVLMTYPDMPNGCTRDYVYVADVVEINKLASEKPANTVVNVGTGEEIAILDIYKEILTVFEKDVAIFIEAPRAGDVRRSVLDAKRAEDLLGWKSEVALHEGLTKLRAHLEVKK
ncbi:SDR family NAD(P)-dependent oxidoreductase [Listeria newyorkensis]|uniref:SDR family NAD(P)-dependent oxidoreductase n=1 Tax=Listeria newyorkensis TaxID=1497681 RepID=A0A841YX22_9LIST|nr:SDR family NAD(P)-dependent oxidoreductase [Listeria newyorkensis]MBC1457848.1 SDR family NAD(P)-dependent oxidoreductase [Listeria newyorkensis]